MSMDTPQRLISSNCTIEALSKNLTMKHIHPGLHMLTTFFVQLKYSISLFCLVIRGIFSRVGLGSSCSPCCRAVPHGPNPTRHSMSNHTQFLVQTFMEVHHAVGKSLERNQRAREHDKTIGRVAGP